MKTEASQSLSYVAPVLRVSDIARSLAFYGDRLGFAVEFVYESFYAGVSRGGGHIHLKCSPPPLRDQTAFERAEQIDVYVCVQGAEMLAESFAATGVAFVVPLRHMPYGIEFYLRDPDGYVLGFVESISASS